jgi:predicted Zn-dependent protease with MMP-like domain
MVVTGRPWYRREAVGEATGYRPTMLPADPSEIDLEIEEFVVDALERLPQPFASQLGSVAIVIEDEPTQAQLAAVGAMGLFGLYQGIPRTRLAADAAPAPSKITLFRGPLVRASRDRAALADRVADTVYHEIAHHFGISDARLHELKGGAH